MILPLFANEETAAAKNERQKLDSLLRVTSAHERLVLVATSAILVSFLAWLFFGSLSRTQTFEGVLVETGSRHEVVAQESGFVTEVTAAKGERVAIGDTLGRQTAPELEREISFLRGRLEALSSHDANVTDPEGRAGPIIHSIRKALAEAEARLSARSRIVSPFDGFVAAIHVKTGEYLKVGSVVAEIRDGPVAQFQPVAFMELDSTHDIAAGMAVRVEIQASDGSAHFLEGKVDSVMDKTLAAGQHGLSDHSLKDYRLLEVGLNQLSNPLFVEGNRCRIHVDLGPVAPIDILLSARG